MKKTLKRVLFWTPRVFGILFAVFLSIFALDVFTEETGFWEELLALLIHLIPTYMVLLVLLFAWKREWLGAILFTALAVFYVVLSGGRQHWSAYVVISGSLVVISILFLLNWIFRAKLREE